MSTVATTKYYLFKCTKEFRMDRGLGVAFYKDKYYFARNNFDDLWHYAFHSEFDRNHEMSIELVDKHFQLVSKQELLSQTDY